MDQSCLSCVLDKNFKNQSLTWNQHLGICLHAKFHTKRGKICHILNQHSKICQLIKFCENIITSKFWTKNALFGFFWARIWRCYSHIENLHPWIRLTAKFCKKTKMLKFWTKKAFLGYFCGAIWKKLLPYLKSASSNLPNCKILQ